MMRNSARPCVIDGCERLRFGREWCQPHYTRWRKYGTPHGGRLMGEERFHAQYRTQSTTGCWIWTGPIGMDGYGKICVRGKHFRAHRFSWELHHDPIPLGLCVCHHCDTPLCVNPQHLFVGTSADNVADRVSKGRTARGSRSAQSKLTESQVLAIKRLLAQDVAWSDIAVEFSVAKNTVRNIARGDSWSWLKLTTDFRARIGGTDG